MSDMRQHAKHLLKVQLGIGGKRDVGRKKYKKLVSRLTRDLERLNKKENNAGTN